MNGGNLPPRNGRGMINSRPDSTPPPPPRQQPELPPAKVEPVRAAPAPQPILTEEPKLVHHTPSTHHEPVEKNKRRFILPLIIAILILIIGALTVVGFISLTTPKTAATGIDSSKFQAVFFTNGQVYFGKLQAFTGDTLKLTNIFYLQTQSSTASTNPQSTSADSSSVQLIKLGDEVHGPEDAMVIEKSQVLFYENLKASGKVAQSIAAYQKAH